MSVSPATFALTYIEGRAAQASEALYADHTSDIRLLHLMTKSQADIMPLITACRSVLELADKSNGIVEASAIRRALRVALTGGE